MDDPSIERSRAPRGMTGRRFWILVGGLIALFLVYVAASLVPRFLVGHEEEKRPLDRCLTEQAVLKYLDGKTVAIVEPKDGVRRITIRKENISFLAIEAGDPPAIRVWFDLEAEGRRYPIEGEFLFRSIDSPDLHQHDWGAFEGRVVFAH